jgi:hypothetical protein
MTRIPTPALPGSGLRDRTAIRHISAGLRQHPLDFSYFILLRQEELVKKKHKNATEINLPKLENFVGD